MMGEQNEGSMDADDLMERAVDAVGLGDPVTIYAFADDWQPQKIIVGPKGPSTTLLSDTWEDCDCDGLFGLVTFEGEIAQPRHYEAVGLPWPHGDDYAAWYTGSWRQMTADEAVSLGLVTPSPAVGGARE